MISVVFTHTNVPAHGEFIAYQIGISDVFTHLRNFYLTYPYKPLGKNEHHHVGRTSFRDVIVMLKCQQILEFLEVLFMVSNIKCGTYNAPLAITICHHSASLVMPIGDPRDKFFYPTLTLIILIISQTRP